MVKFLGFECPDTIPQHKKESSLNWDFRSRSGFFVGAALAFGAAQPSLADRLIVDLSADANGIRTIQLVDVTQGAGTVSVGAPVTVSGPLSPGATLFGGLLSNGGQDFVYLAFDPQDAAIDDLFVVRDGSPGVAQILNGPRVIGTDSPFEFATTANSANVVYSLRDLTTGTDRLFVSSTEQPGSGSEVFGGFPVGSTLDLLTLSPDGRSVGYRLETPGTEPSVWVSFTDAPANATQVDGPPPGPDYAPLEFAFSPDSRRFLWQGNRNIGGTPEPLRMVTLDPDARTITAAVQINPDLVPNERVFEFVISDDSTSVVYRSAGSAATTPSDTLFTALDTPGNAVILNPAPVAGAGLTVQEDVEFISANQVIYNSAEVSANLVDLFSVPTDGSANSALLSGAAGLASTTSSTVSLPGVGNMVVNEDRNRVLMVDGNPAVNLLVIDPASPATVVAPFALQPDQLVDRAATQQADGEVGIRFNPDGEFVATLVDRLNGEILESIDLFVANPTIAGSQVSVFSDTEIEVSDYRWVPDGTSLVSSILPSSRSVQTGTTLTVFATAINAGNTLARNCDVRLASDVPVSFSFQTTDSDTNALVGTLNTPVDIAPGVGQSFVISATPSANFDATDLSFRFGCTNSSTAADVPGVNRLLVAAAAGPVPDVVALAATPSNNGIVDIPGADGVAAFSVATVNVGAGASIQAEVDTGDQALPLVLSLCQSDPLSGDCINPTSPVVGVVESELVADGTQTYSVFATAQGDVANDLANNRIRVVFSDAEGNTRGQTSVAVRTEN